jgi:hypothetical protein
MSDISRGEVLYRRAQGFAKAAFVAAAVMVVAAVASLVSESAMPEWFNTVPVYMAGGVEHPSSLSVVASIVRTWVESAFLIAGAAFLVLTAARVAAADSRPSWAPLIDEQFAKRADIFALLVLAYAGVSLLFSAYGVIQILVRLTTSRAGVAGTLEWWTVQFVEYLVNTASRLFFLVAGALVIQSLVAIATSDYADRIEEHRDDQ